ncbi:MAG: metal ABC transporter solute-binding protein, Zn/Mn family [Rhodoglobus sp.]
MNFRNSVLVAGLAVTSLALAGCATAAPAAEDDGRIQIVSSTSVYGSIAETIGGNLVDVTSLISSAAQDPHSYEASARDQLAISKADLVIENGGGYDPFIDTLLSGAGSSAVVLNAVDASGLLEDDHGHGEEGHADETSTDDTSTQEPTDDHTEEAHSDDDGHDHIEGFNEHVFYDLHGIIHVAEELSHQLGELDPTNVDAYTANFDSFHTQVEALETEAESISARAQNAGVAVTEPVALYLLQASGYENKTPSEFTEAIEEGTDVPPLALQQTLDLFSTGTVSMLGYNEQTTSPETEKVLAAADAAGIPVVSFTETLPEGSDYVSWMTDNLAAIAAATP